MSRKAKILGGMIFLVLLLLLVASALAQAQDPRIDERSPIKQTPVPPGEEPVKEPPIPPGQKPPWERPRRQERAQLTSPQTREGVVLGVPSHNFDVLIWGDDFESGTDDWSWDGLWHPITNTHPSGYGNSYSPVTSFWYGQNDTGNYDTGTTNSGFLQLTTPISLPSSLPSARLSFWSWEETECWGGWCRSDVRKVYVGTGTPTTWDVVWDTRFNATIEWGWHQVVIDLNLYIGQDILLGFEFDSVDELWNDYRGWYIGDVAVGYNLLTLTPAYQEGYGWRGDTITYAITLTNHTGNEDSFDLTLWGNAWPTSLSTDTLGPIPNGGSAEFNVYVAIPTDACFWCGDWVEVTATSVTSPTISASAEVWTYHPYGVWLWTWPNIQSGTPGETITYTTYLANGMSFDDSFSLSLAGNSWPTNLSISNTGVVTAYYSTTFETHVTIPADAPLGASDSVTVTATSDTKPAYYSSIALTTFSTKQGGYSYGDSDEAVCNYDWVDITGSPNYFALDDDDYATVDLGFNFLFYGNTYSQVKVSSNGFLTFNGDPWEYWNQPIPSPGEPNDLIAPFWDDLCPPYNTNPGESLVFAQTFGSAPNRYAVVEWYKIPFYEWPPVPETLTFEAILYENGEMKFQYKEMEGYYGDGKWASVGMENSAGIIGVEYLYDGSPSENLIHDMLAICWEPEYYIYLPLILKQH